MNPIRPIYSSLLYAACPLAMLYLLKRARKQPEYKQHWSERFGLASYPKPKEFACENYDPRSIGRRNKSYGNSCGSHFKEMAASRYYLYAHDAYRPRSRREDCPPLWRQNHSKLFAV